MTNKEAFEVWAPTGAMWADWVRPVPFTAVCECMVHAVANFEIPEICYLSEQQPNTALIIDLPGCEGVMEGLALIKYGFRPVPLYNGTYAQQGVMEQIDNHAITDALLWGASYIKERQTPALPIDGLPDNAPPAFLLDSNRTHRHRIDASVFDNSWDIYDQDMPSPEYFLNNGINQIIIRSAMSVTKKARIQPDLHRILRKFRKKGITILITDGYEKPAVPVK